MDDVFHLIRWFICLAGPIDCSRSVLVTGGIVTVLTGYLSHPYQHPYLRYVLGLSSPRVSGSD